jgi:hypothetical protein
MFSIVQWEFQKLSETGGIFCSGKMKDCLREVQM